MYRHRAFVLCPRRHRAEPELVHGSDCRWRDRNIAHDRSRILLDMAETATRFVGSNSRNPRDGQFGIIWPKMTAALLVGAVAASSKSVRAQANLSNKIKLMLAVQSCLQKYFCFRTPQITSRTLGIPPHKRGVGHRHERGEGCGGRGSILRATGLQGWSKDL